MCPEQWSQCYTVPSFESAVTKYYRSWFRSDARPFLAVYLQLTAANQEHINIYLDKCHHESWCIETTATWKTSCEYNLFLSAADEVIDKKTLVAWTLFYFKHTSLTIIIQADSWQEKWSGPQLQSINLTLHLLSLHSRPPLLIKQRCLSGRISSAWWSPTARPEHRERERIWGARLSGLWGVIPQINMEIMCKACMPIMLSHFFSKSTWNSVWSYAQWKDVNLSSLVIWWICTI